MKAARALCIVQTAGGWVHRHVSAAVRTDAIEGQVEAAKILRIIIQLYHYGAAKILCTSRSDADRFQINLTCL
jgi:hypothetical protein